MKLLNMWMCGCDTNNLKVFLSNFVYESRRQIHQKHPLCDDVGFENRPDHRFIRLPRCIEDYFARFLKSNHFMVQIFNLGRCLNTKQNIRNIIGVINL